MRNWFNVTNTLVGRILILILCVGSEFALAEVVPLRLPSDYTDFAMNPETGTVAAVDSEKNEVAFFRLADLKPPVAVSSSSAKVGATPCSVLFKVYGQVRVFAVVCTQDSHMYLFQADGEKAKSDDFALLKKISLDVSGISSVMGSINPADPFIYYCHGSGHDSAAGVVSLRDMKNHGLAFDDSMDGAIAATGEIAYRRGPWSPSGFESLVLTSGLNAEKPVFGRLFRDHRSTGEYIPDPFGRVTLTSGGVYSVTLEKSLGGLNFEGKVFFQSPPIIVGVREDRNQLRPDPNRVAVTLQAASYNTLTSVGKEVTVPPATLASGTELPRGVVGQADFKRVGKRLRIIADDKRDQILIGDRNQISIVPLSDLEIPDEPLLMARVKGPDVILVDQPAQLTLEPFDARVSVTFDDLPAGMTANGNQITWTPTADQLGPVTVLATLKSQDIQKSLSIELNVSSPSIDLPFTPAGISTSADGEVAVIWEGPGVDEYGRPLEVPAGKTSFRLALVNLKAGKTLAERQIAEAPGRIIISEKHLFILPQQTGAAKCEVLSLKSLERVKSLVASGPILTAERFETNLIVMTDSMVEVYDTDTLAKRKQFMHSPVDRFGRPSASSPVTAEGIKTQGILWDGQLRPILLQSPNPFPVLGSAGNTDMGIPSRPHELHMANVVPPANAMPGNGRSRVKVATVPGSGVQVAVDFSSRQLNVPGAVHTWRNQQEVTIVASGPVDDTRVLIRELSYSQTAQGTRPKQPLLAVTNDTAYVAYGARLYPWKIPSPPADEASSPLRLIQKQTALTLSSDKSTELQHSTTGGKAPIEYSLKFASEGFTVNQETGTVKIENEVVRRAALALLLNPVTGRNAIWGNPYASAAEAAHAAAAQAGAAAQAAAAVADGRSAVHSDESPANQKAVQILGRKTTGVPVALQVGVTVTDADLNTDQLVYYLIVEVPVGDLKRESEKLAKESAQKSNTVGGGPQMPANGAGLGPRDDIRLPQEQGREDDADLRKKVQILEDRIDVLTRQLNELIKDRERGN